MRSLLALLFAMAAFTARAECGCLWRGPFVDVQADTDLVVSGAVVAISGNSIDLAVGEVLRGDEYRNPIRIWLDTDDLCRAEVGSFPLETEWVMALDRIEEVPPGGFDPNTPNISYGRKEDYSLSRCGGFWLKKSENLVTGNLIKGARWERDPKMSPVLLDLVKGYVRGLLDADTLAEASEVDPALQQLIIDTRVYLRRGY